MFSSASCGRASRTDAGETDEQGKRLTGTEEEFKRAYAAWKSTGKPHVAVYRCERPLPIKHDRAQFAAVCDFFDTLSAGKDHEALSQSFDTTAAFAKRVEDDLVAIIRKLRPKVSAFAEVRVLTAAPPHFTGREKDADELLAALGKGEGGSIAGTRAIHGAGGIGKSALARVVARRWLDQHPGRNAVEIDLRGAREDHTPVAAATALTQIIRHFVPQSEQLPIEEDALRDIYLRVLAREKPLVLLDNARDLAQIKPLRPPSGSPLLITSREYLDVPDVRQVHLDKLDRAQSHELLLKLDATLAALADELAAACDDIPKALEVAGSALRGNPLLIPAKLLDGLCAGRHAALDAVTVAVEFSVAQLPPDSQAAWAQLGVFGTSFDEAAAAAVWEVQEASNQLAQLWRASLVEIDSETKRIRLHDRARVVALAQLAEAGEEDTVRLRHAAHYVSVTVEADRLYERGHASVRAGLALFDRERAHLEAAFAWLAPRPDEPSSRLLLRLVNGVRSVGQEMRFDPYERIRWVEVQLTAARRLGDRQSEGFALGNLGNAYRDLGDARRAIYYFTQVLAIARKMHDRLGEANTLTNLGNVHYDLADVPRAMVIARKGWNG